MTKARELAEMVEESNAKAFEIVKRRMSASFDEIRKSMSKKKSG